MKKRYTIYFEIERELGNITIEAKSEEEAEEIFQNMPCDEVLDLSGMVPEFEIEEVFEEDKE